MSEWQPIETIPNTRPVLVLWDAGISSQWSGEDLPPHGDARYSEATHWAPMPTMPAPDPMTVVAWHPMETLPDHDHGTVLIKMSDARAVTCSESLRVNDEFAGRVAWCPLAPLLDLIDKAEQ